MKTPSSIKATATVKTCRKVDKVTLEIDQDSAIALLGHLRATVFGTFAHNANEFAPSMRAIGFEVPEMATQDAHKCIGAIVSAISGVLA